MSFDSMLTRFRRFEEFSLLYVDPEGSFEHCIVVGVSRRLAGYWEKFSISSHHVSVEHFILTMVMPLRKANNREADFPGPNPTSNKTCGS